MSWRKLGRYGCLLAAVLAAPANAETRSAHEVLREEMSAAINPRYLLAGPGGRALSNEDFRGRFQLIAFGYTYCPDVCPTTLVEMAEILQRLERRARFVQPIFISVDPERDTLPVLKTYTEFFDPRILGLTGSPELVRRAAQNFRVRYVKVVNPGSAPENYAVDHSAGMFLLGPDGALVRKFAYGKPLAEITAQIEAAIAASGLEGKE